ncbi:hypothetical protein OKW27_007015 [Paraburkholderia sp. 35.1]
MHNEVPGPAMHRLASHRVGPLILYPCAPLPAIVTIVCDCAHAAQGTARRMIQADWISLARMEQFIADLPELSRPNDFHDSICVVSSSTLSTSLRHLLTQLPPQHGGVAPAGMAHTPPGPKSYVGPKLTGLLI